MKGVQAVSLTLMLALPVFMVAGFTLAIWDDGRWGWTALMLVPLWAIALLSFSISLSLTKDARK